MIELGLVGKPNTGKTTFFNAVTLASAQVASYPFTTVEPNVGVAHVRARCPCTDFGVKCSPRNSLCLGGLRYIPVKIIDVAGLVKGAHEGKGLGNRFLDSLRQASALLHVVDAAGSTDENGRPCPPGTHDPLEDLGFLEEEIDLWLCGILERGWKKFTRAVELRGEDLAAELARRLSGLGITEEQVKLALQRVPFDPSHPLELAGELRRLSKPLMVVANKADLEPSDRNVERIRERGYTVVPVSSEAELLLRRAAERGLISYRPGDPSFRILKPGALTQEQARGPGEGEEVPGEEGQHGGAGVPGHRRLRVPGADRRLPRGGREQAHGQGGERPPRRLPGAQGDHGQGAGLPDPHGAGRILPLRRRRQDQEEGGGGPPAEGRRRDKRGGR
jgi:ribosome-binding ATPase YchF (GTP1/OBG family)